MSKSFKVLNQQREELTVIVDGNEQSRGTLIFVQGFGVSLIENSLYVDIVSAFQNQFTIISFDFAGYGASEGKQEDVSLDTEAQDLDAVLKWTRKKFLGPVYIIAHSLGCYVVSHLDPAKIEKSIFIAPTHQDSESVIKGLQQRMQARGGRIDEHNISVYPRMNGDIQKIGAAFWSTLRAFHPMQALRKYSIKTNLLLIYPKQDEIIPKKNVLKYKALPTLTFKELAGDHNFSGKKERERLFKEISDFLH